MKNLNIPHPPRQAFDYFDRNGSGDLDSDEFRDRLTKLGVTFDPKEQVPHPPRPDPARPGPTRPGPVRPELARRGVDRRGPARQRPGPARPGPARPGLTAL
jgi:hypothetical protein